MENLSEVIANSTSSTSPLDQLAASFANADFSLPPLDVSIAYFATISLAALPIYLGARSSISVKAAETLSTTHAWQFPFIGSAFLFGMYLLFKFFPKDYVNLLLSGYFVFLGIGAMTATLTPIVRRLVCGKSDSNAAQLKTLVTVPSVISSFWTTDKVELTIVDMIAMALSVIISVYYFATKNWIANNILGLAFAIQAISMISLGSYKIGCILLSGLFIYDIFWVFGTDVMVTVAKSFDAPIKLMFPRNFLDVAAAGEPWKYSMLGLGDIVVPGFFIALLLRFDQTLSKSHTPYFNTTLFAYVLGMITTITVMHVFKAAQPALLYLVPFVLIASTGLSIVRGEFGQLWAYTEEDETPVTAAVEEKSEEAKKKD